MSLLKIVVLGNSLLRKKSKEVTDISEIKELAEDMIETMIAAKGLGLAAPQVGVLKRMVIVDFGYIEYDKLLEEGKISEKEKPEFKPTVLINPEILEKSGEYQMEEGCLSVPGYRAEVKRAGKIKFKYTTLDGEVIEKDFDNLGAVAIQHELDHLDGILFIDKISHLKRQIAKRKVKKFIENLDKGREIEYRLYGKS